MTPGRHAIYAASMFTQEVEHERGTESDDVTVP
jgi:hypothetical protein